jgi:hypothetical protein
VAFPCLSLLGRIAWSFNIGFLLDMGIDGSYKCLRLRLESCITLTRETPHRLGCVRCGFRGLQDMTELMTARARASQPVRARATCTRAPNPFVAFNIRVNPGCPPTQASAGSTSRGKRGRGAVYPTKCIRAPCPWGQQRRRWRLSWSIVPARPPSCSSR